MVISMYQSIVKTPDEAICHLFLHCCMKDGKLKEEELEIAADRIVRLNIHRHLDIKLETTRYVEYSSSIADQESFVSFLIETIRAVNPLALYSFCVELVLGDNQLQAGEERLISIIGDKLQLSAEEQQTIKTLIAQRKIMESDKIY